MIVTATELNKHSGKYLEQALKEPVVVEKSGRPPVIMVSYEYYTKLEDAYWEELATEADKEKSIGAKKSLRFLQTL